MRRIWLTLCLVSFVGCVPAPDEGDDPMEDAGPDQAPPAGDMATDRGPTPDLAPEGDMTPPEGDMAPLDPDMGPPDPDMGPPEPDMGPPEADQGPPDPDQGPIEGDMAPPEPDMAPLDPDMAPPEPDMAPPDPDMAPPDPDMAPPVPDMAPPGLCADGDRRQQPCGLNDRGARPEVCVDDAWIEAGPCDDPDVCVDGAEESGPCGPNDIGLSTRTCVEGRWGALGECVLPGVCEAGGRDEVACGLNGRGSSFRACVDGMWGPPGPCDDPDICRDGSDEELACGLNGRGVQLRDCVEGQWADPPPCDDVDVCVDGAAEQRACGLNGAGIEGRTCVEGQWSPYSPCDGADVCLDGAVEERACGLNARGTERRTCADGQWGAYGPCDDPDRCVDGAVEREPCGLNGRGFRSRTCVRGDFTQPEDCVDPDACVDGAVEQRACGDRGDGAQRRLCDAGEWLDWSDCDGACFDACAEGARRCGDDGPELCADVDDDPCVEWGPAAPCPLGTACEAGDCVGPPPVIVINEVLYDQAGSDGSETFIELWGPPGAALDGLALVGVNGNGGADYVELPLDGVIGADGYYVVAEPGASAGLRALADLLVDGADLQNGPDGIQLRRGAAVLDALGYGDAGADFAGEGRPAPDPGDGQGLTRVDHVDTDDNAADFVVADATPRGEPGEDPGECAAGDTEVEPCGLNGRGERTRECVGGAFGPWSACDDPDACVDGAAEDRPCGDDRVQASVCRAGQWTSDALCVGFRFDISRSDRYDGRFIPAGAADEYRLDLDGDRAVRLETGDAQGLCPGDTVLTIDRVGLDGARIEVAFDDDGGLDGCSLIEVELGAGSYIVRVGGFDGGAVPAHVLDVAIGPGAPRVDDGGDFAGDPIPANGFSDWRFDLVGPSQVVAFTSDGAGGCPDDTTLTLYPLGGVEPIAFDDDGGVDFCSRLDVVLDPGAYVLRVAGYDDAAVPAYVLTVRITCVEGSVTGEACPDGAQPLRCVDGAFVADGPCGPAECAPGAVGEEACGFNARGLRRRACFGGIWDAFSPCDDPDMCQDGVEGEAPCGLNGRGLAPAMCVDGQWMPVGACADPDACVDGDSGGARLCPLDPEAATCAGLYRPAPACGVDGWSMATDVCVEGAFAPGPCRDASECVRGAVEAVACGLNGRGLRSRTCVDGIWGAFGGCDDPDVCLDEDERVFACGPDGRGERVEPCIEGRWRTLPNCAVEPPPDVYGYAEGSYEAYAIRRVALLPDEQLQDAGLDRRVSGFIVQRRPYPDLASLAAVEFVEAETFDLLWAEAQARGWVPSCGDGVLMPVEEDCDDGNLEPGDGCDADCRLETVCGDGVVEGAEQCDDGGVGVFDGCSPTCQLETHPTLSGDDIAEPLLPYLKAAIHLFPAERGFFLLDLRQTSRVRFDFGHPVPSAFWYGGDNCPLYVAGFEDRRLAMGLFARYEGAQRGGWVNCPAQGGEIEFDEVLPPGLHVMSLDWLDDRFSGEITIQLEGSIEPVDDAICGDGVREGAEECDDGNIAERDGCSAGCTRQQITEANDNIDRDATAEWRDPGAILRATGTISEGGPFSDRDHFIFESTGGRTVLQLSDRDGTGCDADAALYLYRGVLDDLDRRIASSVDGGIDFCPRIETTLAAGTYSVVAAIAPPNRGGPYLLEVRTSPRDWDEGVPPVCRAWCLATTDCAPRSQDELAQCAARCAAGTLPADDLLRVADGEACLLAASERCDDLRDCVAEAAPVEDCDGLCADLEACGVPAGDCAAACDVEALVCVGHARRRGEGCAAASACVGAEAAPAACVAYCDRRVACDPTVGRFDCEVECALTPGAAARRACAERVECAHIDRCLDLDDGVPPACVDACDAVDGCGLFADRAACEGYCAGQAGLAGDDLLAALPGCVADVAACGFEMTYCFAPPVCVDEVTPLPVVDLGPDPQPVAVQVVGAGDDYPRFCSGSSESFVALRLAYPARVRVAWADGVEGRFFIADRCDPADVRRCGSPDSDLEIVLGPGTHYLGAEQPQFSIGSDVELTVSATPLDVLRYD